MKPAYPLCKARCTTSGQGPRTEAFPGHRNLEMVRLLLNASVGWKAMRMVRNEDEVVAGMLAAVQEWNSENCLLRRFDRDIKNVCVDYLMQLGTGNCRHGCGRIYSRIVSGTGSCGAAGSKAALLK
jgi:hypothetical protein